MGFMNRELNRIALALREPQPPQRYAELYAAQQALSWALEPDGFRSPYSFLMSTSEGSAGCLACPGPPLSADRDFQTDS